MAREASSTVHHPGRLQKDTHTSHVHAGESGYLRLISVSVFIGACGSSIRSCNEWYQQTARSAQLGPFDQVLATVFSLPAICV
jgi:hypothetical protein